MEYRLLQEAPRTFAVVLRTGDEIAGSLTQLAREEGLAASSFTALGACSSVKLLWFDWSTKRYAPSVHLDEQAELLSLVGDIARKDGEPVVHAHAVVAGADGVARGGHLAEAIVRPTCEIFLIEYPEPLEKRLDAESGLSLIRF